MNFPSFTRTWHNNTYPAISSTSPSVSAAGKTIFITGGGAGIGLSIAKSFATAGASKIAISGRTEKTLLAAKATLESAYPKTKIVTHVADIIDEAAVNKAFASVGRVDVLVNNAAYMPDLHSIADSSIDDWWKGFEVNIKGSFIVTRAFLKSAAPNASLINMTTAAVHLPAFPNYSAYAASKIGSSKFFDGLQAENPQLHVVNVAPGVIKSDMSDRAVAQGAAFPYDHASLPSDFIVWVTSAEGKFLKGKSVWANFDVEEMKTQAGKIEASPLLSLGLLGLLDTGFNSATNPGKTNIAL